jgi:pimeloyl-ACP methyl ester carboxylesterase
MSVLTLGSGARMRCDESGEGAPLVLVHGSPGSASVWARVAGLLAPSLRVRAPDLPGYGRSDPLPSAGGDGTAAVAAALGELIDDCGEPVWLCGHSYGGNVALHAALRRPERVKGIVLLEPVFMRALHLAGAREMLLETRAFFTSYLVRVAFAEPDAVSLMIDFWLGAGAYARLPPSAQRQLAGLAAKNAEDVRASFSETITAAELAAFDRPVLVLHGGAGNAVARAIASSLATLLPQARLGSIPGAGHAMIASHPAEVAAAIERFCAASRPIARAQRTPVSPPGG